MNAPTGTNIYREETYKCRLLKDIIHKYMFVQYIIQYKFITTIYSIHWNRLLTWQDVNNCYISGECILVLISL